MRANAGLLSFLFSRNENITSLIQNICIFALTKCG